MNRFDHPPRRACNHHAASRWFKAALLCAVLVVGGGVVSAAQVTIGILGDYGAAATGARGFSNELSVANLIKSWQPDFIITTGDNNYPNGEAANIDTNVGQFFREYIHPYLGTFGPGGTSNRFFPSIGNHDWPYGVSYLAPYLAYFTLPGNERYYSHRYGPVEVFALVGDQQEPDGATNGSVQWHWFSNAVARSTAPWRIAFFHASPYSSGSYHGWLTHETDNMLWPFRELGVQAVFSGHDHIYERVVTNGLNYCVIGVGGDRIDRFGSPYVPGSVARYNATYGAGRVVLTETNLVYNFINISNQLIDSYSLEVLPARLTLRLTNDQPRLELRGSPGRTYITEISSSLTNWAAVATNTLAAAVTNLPLPSSKGTRVEFYRARTAR